MRRELVVFAVILAVLLALGLFGRSLVVNTAIGQIKSAFPGYAVSIGSAEFRGADTIAITGIDIKKDDTLHYRIRELGIKFSPLSLFTRIIPKVTVKDGSLEFKSTDKKLSDIIEYPVPKPGKGFVVRSLIVTNTTVVLNTADWKIVSLFDGNMEMRGDITYNAAVTLSDLNLAVLSKGLNAEEKVDLSGHLAGNLSLEGKNLKIAAVKGDFSTVEIEPSIGPGGKLVIKDEEFLKKLAENTKQPLSIIEEGFKYYEFTKGTLQVSRNADSILFHIILDGAKGKRDLTVALHGF